MIITHNRFLRAAHAIYDVIVILLINSPFKDSGSFVAFKAKHVRNLNLVHNDHRYLPLIVFYKGGKNIKELVVSHKQRGYGVSKYTTFNKIIPLLQGQTPCENMQFVQNYVIAQPI